MTEKYYYKIHKDKGKVFYVGLKEIGDEYTMIKHFITKGISSSKSHKLVAKIKLFKDDDNNVN